MPERVDVFLDFEKVQAILDQCEVSALKVDTICTQPEIEMSPDKAAADCRMQEHSSTIIAPLRLEEQP